MPNVLPADPQLQQDEIGAVDGHRKIGRGGEFAVPPMAAGDAPADSADRIEPCTIGIAQHELIDLDLAAHPGDPIDELRRVGAPTPDHGNLHCSIMARRGQAATGPVSSVRPRHRRFVR